MPAAHPILDAPAQLRDAAPPAGEARDAAEPRATPERAVLLAVGLGTTLAPLNSTMIAVALPRILAEFSVGIGASAWLVTAYLVAMAALQPLAGTLGDRFGRRRLMLLGLAWFGLVSLGAAAAQSFALLAACRIQQGVAGAIALPNGVAVARSVLPAARRARGFSFIGALTGVAAAAGPPLGGLLVGSAGWRAMFLANVPVVVGSLLLAWWAVPRGVDHTDHTSGRAAGPRGWLPQLAHPRAYAAACAGVCLSNLGFYVTLLVVPLLVAQPDRSPAETGAVLSTLLLASLSCTPVGGYLADRLGRRRPAVGGLLVMSAGLAGFALVTRAGAHNGAVSVPALMASLAAAGAGLGIAGSGMQTTAVEAAGPASAGAAAGLFSTSRYVGSITGSAALAALAGGATGGTPNLDAVSLMVVSAGLLSAVACLGLHDRSPD